MSELKGRRSIHEQTPEADYSMEMNLNNSSFLSASKQRLDLYSEDDRSLSGSTESLNFKEDTSKEYSPERSKCKLDRRTVDRSPERTKHETSDQSACKQAGSSCVYYIIAILIVVLGILSLTSLNIATIHSEKVDPKDCSFAIIQQMFNEDIQDTVLVAISEIERFNKPSVITFLHQQGNKRSIDRKLKEVLAYATCRLNGGSEYVEVTDGDRTSPAILADPGKLITKYQRSLAAKNVMLVKHLENMHEDLVMKFHFICDEITTYVDRALIVFTIEHDEDLAESDYRIVEKVLAKSLKHTKADFILPLLARITNAIIRL